MISFTREEAMFRDAVREFAQRYIAPRWVEIDEEASRDPMKIPLDLIGKMGEQGLYCIPCSDRYGGQGGTITMAAIAVEEVAYADPSVAIAVYLLLNNGWPFALQLFGREDVLQEVLPKVARGEAFFGIASTEPQGGSDVAGIRTSAVKRGNVYVISGEKSFISGVGEVQQLPWGGGWFLLARTGGEGHRGISAFAFLARRGGRVVNGWVPYVYRDIGRHGLTTGGFKLENAEVEDRYLIGEENRGFYYVMEGFNIARILVAAATVGGARWLLEQAIQWMRTRRVFGKYIASFEGVSFRFAELYAKYEAARYFVYRAARLADKIYVERDPAYSPRDLNVPAALAKMYGPELASELAQEVMKWYGALSYTKDSPIHRAWLGLLSYVVGAEGAQNIMRYIVARDIIGSEYVR